MLIFHKPKNQIFLRLISLITLQVFILIGVVYPETYKKDMYGTYISHINRHLRVPMGALDKKDSEENRFSKLSKEMHDAEWHGEELTRDTLLEYLETLAKPINLLKPYENELKEKGKYIARLYITKEKIGSEGPKRNQEDIGYPIIIAGEVYWNDKPLPVEKVEELYGLECQRDEHGNELAVIVNEGGGRMFYLGQAMTVLINKNGRTKGIYFGNLTEVDFQRIGIWEDGDTVLEGDTVQFKGAGAPEYKGRWVEKDVANRSNIKEVFKKVLREARVKEAEINKKIESIPDRIIKEGSQEEEFRTENDERFGIVNEDGNNFIFFQYENASIELRNKYGIFEGDGRYQLMSDTKTGVSKYFIEKRGMEYQALIANAKLHTWIIKVMPFSQSEGKIHYGICIRIGMGSMQRLDAVDYARTAGESQGSVREVAAGLIRGNEQTIFQNVGINTKEFLLAGLCFSRLDLREGKDFNIKGSLADIGDFEHQENEEVKIDKINLIARWLRFLIEVNISINWNEAVSDLFVKQAVKPSSSEYLNGLLDEYLTLFMKEEQKDLLMAYLNSFFGEKDNEVGRIIQKEIKKIHFREEILKKWGSLNNKQSELSLTVGSIIGEIIYKEWEKLPRKETGQFLHASWANVKELYEGWYYDKDSLFMPDGRKVDKELIGSLRVGSLEGYEFVTKEVNGQGFLISKDIIDTLSDEEALTIISKAVEKARFERTEDGLPLIISSLSKSLKLFENCKKDGFIGINQAFLKLYEENKDDSVKKQYLQILLQAGLEHELKHEMGEGDEDKLIAGDVERIVELCKINSSINIDGFIIFFNEIIDKRFKHLIELLSNVVDRPPKKSIPSSSI